MSTKKGTPTKVDNKKTAKKATPKKAAKPKVPEKKAIKEVQLPFEEVYNLMIKNLVLTQVVFTEMSMTRNPNISVKKGNVDLEKRTSCKISDQRKGFRAFENLKVVMTTQDTKEEVFTLDLTLLLEYQTEVEVTKEMIELFAQRNLPLHSWPYLREQIQSLTQKAGLPSIRLPVLLLPG